MAYHVMQTQMRAVFYRISLILLMWLLPVQIVQALEIHAVVKSVDENARVELDLPAGASVAPGDTVRIEAELPGLGVIAIDTHWRVTGVSGASITASPDGPPSGIPVIGYTAIIETSVAQGIAKRKDPGIHECDRLGANVGDTLAVSKGVSYSKLDAELTVTACKAALAQYPDTLRFMNQLGRGLHKLGQKDEAMKVWGQASQQGSVQATAFLAAMYRVGDHVQKEPKKALRLFEQAAEGGSEISMLYAAGLLQKGTDVPKDEPRAVYWYEQAVKLGNSSAMTNLAIMVSNGMGTKKNSIRAAQLILDAHSAGNKRAREILFEKPSELTVKTRKDIQRFLLEGGYYSNTIDGKFGPGTQKALEQYSKAPG